MTIAIIYDENRDSEVAEGIKKGLSHNSSLSVDIVMYPINYETTIESVYAGWGVVPELIITINLAGFSYRSSGDNGVYATLDNNSIHYIDRDLEDEDRLLSGLITITMKFITDTEERCERIDKTYRRIHDISVCPDISEDIAGIVDGIDLRKR